MTSKWEPVVVEWDDAHGGELTWEKITPRHHRPERIITVGQLVSENEKGVTVALSRDSRGHVDAYIFIPRSGLAGPIKKL